jgi:hypothetical protein
LFFFLYTSLKIRAVTQGETVRTNGTTTTLTTKEKVLGTQNVYNLEVYREHNYSVSESGILVHNGCADDVDKALTGKINGGKNWKTQKSHAHFDDDTTLDILKNHDQVYVSQSKRGNIIYRLDTDIVVVGGKGSGSLKNKVMTGYGPRGTKNASGAKALGGKASDPGAPVTHEMITNGKIPGQGGRFLAPAKPTTITRPSGTL